jgi:hypothetical protein
MGCFGARSQITSSTAASVIITNARDYLNEPSEILWSDDDLLVHVNSGIYDIIQRTHCLENSTSINMVANQHEYDFSGTDYVAIKAVVYVDTSGIEKGLIRKNVQGIGHSVKATGTPTYYYEWNSYVGIYPVLASISDPVETITVYYVDRPTKLASTAANITVPAIYDRALTLYVVAEAWKKDGQFAKSRYFMTEYLAELERYRQDFNDKPKEDRSIVK